MKLKQLLTDRSFWESSLKYCFAALLIFVPLYPKFPLFSIPGSRVAIRAEDFLILVLAFLLVPLVPYYLDQFRKSLVLRSMALYWLVALLAVISGVYITRTTSLSIAFLHWARRIEYMVPFFAAAVLATKKENLKFFLSLILPIALAVWGYALAQIYLNAPVISTQNEEFSKGIALTLSPGVNISSTFAGHYDLAGYLVMTMSLVLALAIGTKEKRWKFLQLAALLPLLWLLTETGSRIAFGAGLVALPLILLLTRRPVWILPLMFVAVVAAANSPKLVGRFGDILRVFRFDTIQETVKGVWDSRTQIFIPTASAAEATPTLTPTPSPEPLRAIQQDRSTSIRLDVEWPRALRALSKNPLLGTGFASITLATDNDYLRALGETGAFGFLAWISIIIAILASLIRGLKTQTGTEFHYLAGVSGLVVAFLIIATFIDIFEASKNATLFWMYTGLAEGILWRKKA